jgi:hypothetical protein
MRFLKIFVFVLSTSSSNGFSCSCDTIPFIEAVDWADEIFIGTIVKAEKVKIGFGMEYRWAYTFEVDKKWKGNSNTRLTLYQEGHSCDLGFQLWPDQYLIYASHNSEFKSASVSVGPTDGKSRLHTWLCSRTTYALESDDCWFESDVKKLDKMFPNHITHKRKNLTGFAIISVTVWLLFSCLILYILRKLPITPHKK